jgi:hypothetical protein
MVHPLREPGLVLRPPVLGEIVGTERAESGMRSVVVVLGSPVVDQDLGLEQLIELLDGSALVTRP